MRTILVCVLSAAVGAAAASLAIWLLAVTPLLEHKRESDAALEANTETAETNAGKRAAVIENTARELRVFSGLSAGVSASKDVRLKSDVLAVQLNEWAVELERVAADLRKAR